MKVTEREIRMPVRCPDCEHEFKHAMTPEYARDIASCITAALMEMPPIDGRVFPPKRGSDGC